MKRRTFIPKRLPRPSSPDQATREYFKNLRKYALTYISLMKQGLKDLVPELKEIAADDIPEIRSDSQERMDVNIEKKIQTLFDWVQDELDASFSEALLNRWVRAMIAHTNKSSKRNISSVAKKVGLEVEPLLHDRDLSPFYQNVVDENIGLIKSIATGKKELFKNKMVALITKDAPSSQIAEAIQKYLDPEKGNVINGARRIARDQVGKLNGSLNEFRQKQLGGKAYFWRGSMDERERPDHKRLEGKRFLWSKPPITDRRTGARNHPGKDYECRCHAEMDLSDVVD